MHGKTHRRRLGSAAAVMMIALGSMAIGQVSTAGAASARCVGAGSPVETNIYAADSAGLVVPIAWEDPVSGTCNDNGIYQGVLHVIGGWTAEVWRQNSGQWHREGTADPGAPGSFSWTASTHQSQEVLCVRRAPGQLIWTCGAGTNTGTYGTLAQGAPWPLNNFGVLNHGF